MIGEAINRTLTVYKPGAANYPRAYYLTQAFAGYPAITDYQLQTLTEEDLAARIADFELFIAQNENVTDLGVTNQAIIVSDACNPSITALWSGHLCDKVSQFTQNKDYSVTGRPMKAYYFDNGYIFVRGIHTTRNSAFWIDPEGVQSAPVDVPDGASILQYTGLADCMIVHNNVLYCHTYAGTVTPAGLYSLQPGATTWETVISDAFGGYLCAYDDDTLIIGEGRSYDWRGTSFVTISTGEKTAIPGPSGSLYATRVFKTGNGDVLAVNDNSLGALLVGLFKLIDGSWTQVLGSLLFQDICQDQNSLLMYAGADIYAYYFSSGTVLQIETGIRSGVANGFNDASGNAYVWTNGNLYKWQNSILSVQLVDSAPCPEFYYAMNVRGMTLMSFISVSVNPVRVLDINYNTKAVNTVGGWPGTVTLPVLIKDVIYLFWAGGTSYDYKEGVSLPGTATARYVTIIRKIGDNEVSRVSFDILQPFTVNAVLYPLLDTDVWEFSSTDEREIRRIAFINYVKEREPEFSGETDNDFIITSSSCI